ncbi:hypothetical protein LINPERPRIM_LOCUS38823 [Linum perenne]
MQVIKGSIGEPKSPILQVLSNYDWEFSSLRLFKSYYYWEFS